MSEESLRQCEACGASIYREHLDTGIAGYWESQLLCAHCFEEKERESGAFSGGGGENLDTISLADDDETVKEHAAAATQVRQMSETQLGMGAFNVSGLNRPTDPESPCATRCRTFHAKLNEGAVAYMNREINEWVDGDETIRIKFSTAAIGIYEGKRQDPHLIVTVFY